MKQAVTRYVKDFFGINNVTSKDIAGAFRSVTKLPHGEIAKKYKSLIRSRNLLANQVFERDARFGVIRRDIDNEPKSHGQFEPTNEKKLFDTVEVKQQFVPNIENDESETTVGKVPENVENHQETLTNHQDFQQPYKISDVAPVISLDEVLSLFRKEDQSEDLQKYLNTAPLTFFFDKTPRKLSIRKTEIKELNRQINVTDFSSSGDSLKLSGGKLDEAEIKKSINEVSSQVDKKPPLEYDLQKDNVPSQEIELNSEEYFNQKVNSTLESDIFGRSLDDKYDEKQEPESMGALDYLKKIRSKKIEPTAKRLKHKLAESENAYNFSPTITLDSKGFNIYTYQVPDWSKCRRADVLVYLKRAIIFNNYDIIAINKPYGLASHESSRQKERFDVNSLMQVIANEMRISKVYLTHRLDKTTSGVLLFATSQEQANRINKLFKSDQIKKAYWCITSRIPEPETGLIDIPIGEYEVANKMRSCLVPVSAQMEKQLAKRYKEARRAVTEYKVLARRKDAALVEVKPRTGVKHQIRCHLSYALGTPILGDHKYSNMGKLAPQKLPASLLKSFHIRQEKVRTLPIHLHAKSIVIPGIKPNGETLHIDAPLPKYFVDNLKRISLINDYVSSKIKG